MLNKANNSYEIETEAFSGPLHLLLELIEKEQLPITEVTLAGVTQQYLEHIEEYEVDPEHLADFLVMATRLLYLKSKELLPHLQAEEEEGAQKLAGQLRLYQLFVEAAKHVDEVYQISAPGSIRPTVSLPSPDAPVWPEGLESSSLQEVFNRLLKYLRPFLSLRQTSMERVRSVGERMEELRSMIRVRARIVFRDLTASAKTKMDVVVSFLALLELVKQQTIRTSQPGSFHEITIDRI